MGRAFEYRKAAKEKRWGNMSRIFPKLGKSITMAAKEGGGDPDMNPPLRLAIQNAKAQNMPKDNIEAAIKRATGKDAADIAEVNFEGKGPHGSLLFIECATDNNTRTVANIRSYLKRHDGEMLKNGSLEFMFSRKAVFEFDKTDEMDLEELELELIDAGLEELDENEGTVYIYGDYTSFASLSSAIEAMEIEVKKGSLQRISNNPQTFSEAQMTEVERLIDRIEDDDDVQAVYTNIN